jgi:predicted nucleic acid-binding protein
VIVVDSSVWIAWLNGSSHAAARKLDEDIDPLDIIVGDIALLEILQGARSDRHAADIRQRVKRFRLERMLDADLTVRSARNYRLLRGLGYTIRKVPDLIIGTFCIEHDHELLQADRDFTPMVRHLGLRLA